ERKDLYKDIILKEIKKYIPVTIEPWIIISLVEFIIGDEYKYFFEYNTQMLEYNISSYQYKMVKWLANALINHKDDYMVLRLIPQSRKDELKFSLYKEIVTNISSNTIRRIVFDRMVDEGFENDVNITLEFLSKTNLFETYASSCFDGRGKLLLKAFAKVIK
ncbi:25635_t:CDS:1, partial [Racocetra persica]